MYVLYLRSFAYLQAYEVVLLPIGLVTPDKPHNNENQEAAWI